MRGRSMIVNGTMRARAIIACSIIMGRTMILYGTMRGGGIETE